MEKAQHHRLASHTSQRAPRGPLAWRFLGALMAPRGQPDTPAEHQAGLPALNQAVEKYKEAGGQHLLQPPP